MRMQRAFSLGRTLANTEVRLVAFSPKFMLREYGFVTGFVKYLLMSFLYKRDLEI